MGSGIYIAATGAIAQSQALDVTSNNVANAATSGFKAQRVSFSEALATAKSADSSFVGVGTASTDQTDGAIKMTENPLDLALVGDGFFALETPRGVRYTRAGDFRLNDEGTIVNGAGFAARAAGGGSITIPEGTTSITIDATGAVFADEEEVGQLELARFAPDKMSREGASLFAAQGAALEGDNPEIISGAVESSNVNIVRGVVDLVKISRTYESLMKMIEGFSRIESRAAREIGGPK